MIIVVVFRVALVRPISILLSLRYAYTLCIIVFIFLLPSAEVHQVPLQSGFTESQALQTLAMWTEKTVETLPSQAHAIYKASKGSPLVISLVGSLLKDHPQRWESYLKKLQEKKYSRLRKASSYEYESVDEAMGISLEQLAKDSKDLYSDFAIFDEDVKVPAKVGFVHGPWYCP